VSGRPRTGPRLADSTDTRGQALERPSGTLAPNAPTYHCRYDPQEVRIELVVPKGARGTVRVFIIDPDRCREQRVAIAEADKGLYEDFAKGCWIEHPLDAQVTANGKVLIRATNLNEKANAVVSIVEWVEAPPPASRPAGPP
jgi:hypothetical protein